MLSVTIELQTADLNDFNKRYQSFIRPGRTTMRWHLTGGPPLKIRKWSWLFVKK